MKKTLLLLLFFVSFSAFGQTGPEVSVLNSVLAAIKLGTSELLPLALTWLGSFMMIQFIITNIGLLKSGADIEAVFAKLLGSLLWFGFCVYAINNGPEFIQNVGDGILSKFVNAHAPASWTIWAATLTPVTALIALAAVVGTSAVGNTAIATMLIGVAFMILGIGAYFIIKIMMLTLELGLIVMLSPLSFALLGINALKDQGIAPFKSLLSLVYRMVLIGILFKAYGEVSDVMGGQIPGGIDFFLSPLKTMNGFFSALMAYPVLFYLLYKSDSIAAALAGGSSSMGPADVAGAAAAGAAAGALAGSAGSAAGTAATKIPGAMPTLGIANAGGRGSGGVDTAMPRPELPSSSLAGVSSSGAAMPAENPFAGTTRDPAFLKTGGNAVVNEQTSGPDLDANASPAASPAASSNTTAPSSKKAGTELPSSAATAGIGGAKIDDVGAPQKTQQPANGKGFLDHLGNTTHHVAKETSATHVSINTNNLD